MKSPGFILALAFCAIITGIFVLPTRLHSTPPAKATAETLKQLEGEFMKAAGEKGSQGYMSYYADESQSKCAIGMPTYYWQGQNC